VATSAYSYLTVVTIFVVLVVYGDSSIYSTHLILFRRFSILYAYFYRADSCSTSFPTVFPFCCCADPDIFAYFFSRSSASYSSRSTFACWSVSMEFLAFNLALNYWVSLVSYSLNLFSHLNSMA
jgi:hypothetical protein